MSRAPVGTRGLSLVYRGRGRRTLSDLYESDHAEERRGGRFRWLLSTCLAATVGSVAIGIAIFGSLDDMETSEGVPSVLKRLRDAQLQPVSAFNRQGDGVRWVTPKADRLQPGAGVVSLRQIIPDQVQVRRDGRPFIDRRLYARVVSRLQPVPARNFDVIPAFDPFILYSADSGEGRDAGQAGGQRTDFRATVQDLLGAPPVNDAQELDAQEVAEIVAQIEAEEALGAIKGPDGIADAAATGARAGSEEVPPNTTVLQRMPARRDGLEEAGRGTVRTVKFARGDSLLRILQNHGSDGVQARAMVERMRTVLPESAVTPGLLVHITQVPSIVRPDTLEPARFTVATEAGEHRVTVLRNASGEYVASAQPLEAGVARAAQPDGDSAHGASVYAALYNAALTQGIQAETILQKLRVHAYDTDFRRTVSAGDYAEFFFDWNDQGSEGSYGDLLFTALSTGGETYRYWRFRTPDNIVDYYDEHGNNSKKFLMRRPVRGEAVRLVSGFGLRRHPLLGIVRPHTGIDWAGPTGTPVLAAGNGVIEEAGRKGDYGNYIRIRHANGYHTSYAHLSNYGPRTREGARVRQGEVIGYIGTTGLSAGPHLHFEVLVNSRHVDPLTIQVPRERQLTGKQLADFQRERGRIDELMRRQPINQQQ